MKFLDLFAGIGGFRLGLEAAGHECIGFCEIDKFARASYKAIHDTKGEVEFHDITRVSDESIRAIGSVDIICGGFPCQAFSIAGNRRGFEDTRGTLFFEIARFASILRPRYLFLENVKGLLNHDGGATFETILRTLDELGYNVEWQVLNSKDFGVPQNRERVFLIGHLREESSRPVFPIEGSESEIIDLRGQQAKQMTVPEVVIAGQLEGSFEMSNRVYDPIGLAPTLRTMQGGGNEPKIIQRGHGYNRGGEYDLAPTLTSNSYQENNHLLDGFRIRKLTPRECWRLQGFPDWAFDKAQAVNSNSQLYKQAGNGVTVNIIAAIAKRLENK